MIASGRSHSRQGWHPAFLAMLPTIRAQAKIAFHDLQGDNHDHAVQETVANACVAFARLVHRGRSDAAFPTVLARFAIAQVRAGRQVGSSLNVRDVLSRYAQHKKRFVVERLDRKDRENESWIEAVVEDPHTSVFEQVWFRIDFPEWLSRLIPRNRRVAEALALGHSTQDVARRIGTSPARVSQLRHELYESWQEFHGELVRPTSDPRTHQGSRRRCGVVRFGG